MVNVFKVSNIVLCVSLLLAGLFSTTNPTAVEAASIPATVDFNLIASGLTNPDFITNAGDGSNRLFILQQTGQILIFKNGSLLATPFLNILGQVSNFTGFNGEQGLLSLAFDPSYITNGIFYITYTTNTSDPTFPYTTTLARYHVSSGNSNVADPGSGVVLLSIPKKYTNHNGGMIVFGPDGYLYMSMGDGGSGGDPDNNAQNIHTMLGKLLRLDVHTTPPVGQKYVIPSTNPFYGSSDATVKKEIWAYGLRNPWRFSFDRLTGDLYIGDVGQDREEEVDFQSRSSAGGQNYGWRILEGNLCYNPSSNCSKPSGYVPPVATYDHGTNDSYGCSLTGGYVYRGSKSPSLQGVYFYGDYCSGKLLGLVRNSNNTWTHSLIVSTNYSISSFGEDEHGELYLSDYSGGNVYQITAGHFTISGNAGSASAALNYMEDGTPKFVTADGSGNYSISVLYGWTGTITPHTTGYTFNPISKSYSNVTSNQTAQNYVALVCANCSDANIAVGTVQMGSYSVAPTSTLRLNYPLVVNGPVKVTSADGSSIFTSQRVTSGDSYNELLGMPSNQFTTEYWFPYYDHGYPNISGSNMRTWVLVGNPSTSQSASVNIYIGGNLMSGSPFSIPAGKNITPRWVGVQGGPVRIVSTNGVNIFASERVFTSNSNAFSESLGLAVNKFTTEYWFPWYDNVNMKTSVVVGNTSSSQAANVDIYIGGVLKGSDSIPANTTRFYPDASLIDGPVRVVSTNGVNIVTSLNSISGPNNSFSDVIGMPFNQFTTEYWFPYYDHGYPNVTGSNMRTWVLVGNPSTSQSASVNIYIGGNLMSGSPFSIQAGRNITPRWVGVQGGPLRVVSDIPVFASERVFTAPNSSFNEMFGYPLNQLTSEYWYPWYDSINMNNDFYISKP